MRSVCRTRISPVGWHFSLSNRSQLRSAGKAFRSSKNLSRAFSASASGDDETKIEAEVPESLHDEQTDEQFTTNNMEESMVALVNAPATFTTTLMHQLLRQLLTSDVWVLLQEPPKKVAGGDDEEMEYRLLELDLAHATRNTVPTFTSEARAEEAVETAGYGSVEGVAVPGLQLLQDFKKAGVPTDLVVNPFSRYGKRIAWEEVEWLAANGHRLLSSTPAPREPTMRAVEIVASDLPQLPDFVESPVRDPFKLYVRPTPA